VGKEEVGERAPLKGKGRRALERKKEERRGAQLGSMDEGEAWGGGGGGRWGKGGIKKKRRKGGRTNGPVGGSYRGKRENKRGLKKKEERKAPNISAKRKGGFRVYDHNNKTRTQKKIKEEFWKGVPRGGRGGGEGTCIGNMKKPGAKSLS